MTYTTAHTCAHDYRNSPPKLLERWDSWTVITHCYSDEDGVPLSEITTFDLLLEDVGEWFGLTPRQREELVDQGIIGFIPDTHGECFGFNVNTEEMTALKEEIRPQVGHIAQGSQDTYLYSVRHLIEYDQLWEMFDWDPDEHEDCPEEVPSWHKDIKAEFEAATILWRFNTLDKNHTDLDVDDIVSFNEIFRGTHSAPQYLFEVPRSAYNRIYNTSDANHS